MIPFVGSISPDLPWLQLELFRQETGAEWTMQSDDGNTGTLWPRRQPVVTQPCAETL